jgi:hypothetical protein
VPSQKIYRLILCFLQVIATILLQKRKTAGVFFFRAGGYGCIRGLSAAIRASAHHKIWHHASSPAFMVLEMYVDDQFIGTLHHGNDTTNQ